MQCMSIVKVRVSHARINDASGLRALHRTVQMGLLMGLVVSTINRSRRVWFSTLVRKASRSVRPGRSHHLTDPQSSLCLTSTQI